MKIVNPYTTSLNEANAYWMAKLSKVIYTSVSTADKTPNEAGILDVLQSEDNKFKTVKGFSNNSTQAGLVEHEDYLCMTFRGTDETLDWLDNIDAFSVKEIFGEFHRGFWKATEDVWENIFTHYQILYKAKTRPLFLTGHSLGGAIATIAAAKLIHQDLPFISVYTFGQPRAISLDTSRIFNMECKNRFFRFQNNNDLVTRVPARTMGYSHVGTCIYITEHNDLHNDPGYWFRFIDSIDGAMAAFKEKGIDGIEDHNMDKYLRAVDDWNINF